VREFENGVDDGDDAGSTHERRGDAHASIVARRDGSTSRVVVVVVVIFSNEEHEWWLCVGRRR